MFLARREKREWKFRVKGGGGGGKVINKKKKERHTNGYSTALGKRWREGCGSLRGWSRDKKTRGGVQLKTGRLKEKGGKSAVNRVRSCG